MHLHPQWKLCIYISGSKFRGFNQVRPGNKYINEKDQNWKNSAEWVLASLVMLNVSGSAEDLVLKNGHAWVREILFFWKCDTLFPLS